MSAKEQEQVGVNFLSIDHIDATHAPMLRAPEEHLLKSMWRTPDGCYWVGSQPSAARPIHGSEAALTEVRRIRSEGGECFYATAVYQVGESRSASSATGAWGLWLDLDVGADKAASGEGYESRDRARAALIAFCEATDLPSSSELIDSGGGWHAYFVFDRFLSVDEWRTAARKLKALCSELGLCADPSRTADITSFLRAPGSVNLKLGVSRSVVHVRHAEPLVADDFLQRLSAAHQRFCKAVLDEVDTREQPRAVSLERLAATLSEISPETSYARWVDVLMAVHFETRGSDEGLALATHWSREQELYQGADTVAKRWAGFDVDTPNPKTYGTLRWMAKEEVKSGVVQVDAPAIVASAKQAAAEAQQVMLDMVDRAKAVAATEDTKAPSKSTSRSPQRRARKTVAGDVARETHHEFAKALLARLTVDAWEPVAHEGDLFVANPETSIWERQEVEQLSAEVAQGHDGFKNCVKASDYIAIAKHATSLVSNDRFFGSAPVGLASGTNFYSVGKDDIEVVPLSPDHRQRVRVEYTPREMPTPLFDAFLRETFRSENEGEEVEQVRLLQEIAGAVMTGLAARFHKAYLFHDPVGRAGKGTMERIIQRLVPREFVTSISPHRWDEEYYAIQLLGARLNVVGELPENKVIPAHSFKSVLGGDVISGRNPARRVVTFKNEAAHLFTANHLTPMGEHGEAVFARWVTVSFPNSRIKLNLPLEQNLDEKIIQAEMPGIAHWALIGARRLLQQGYYSKSAAHDRLIAAWRRRNSSLEEFIFDVCELSADFKMRRSEFYQQYKDWCEDAGRKAFAKGRVKDLLAANVPLGIRHAVLDGHEMFRGVRLKADVKPALEKACEDFVAMGPDLSASDGKVPPDPDF